LRFSGLRKTLLEQLGLGHGKYEPWAFDMAAREGWQSCVVDVVVVVEVGHVWDIAHVVGHERLEKWKTTFKGKQHTTKNVK
jgi:hypothetical protein